MSFSRESFFTDPNEPRPEFGYLTTTPITFAIQPAPDTMPIIAQNFVDFISKMRGVQLDYSATSLEYVDAGLQAFYNHKDPVDHTAELILMMGCYIGEVIVRKTGGKWINPREADWPVRVSSMMVVAKLPTGLYIDPLAKAFRRAYYGPVDSIVDYYMELVSACS